MNPLAKLQRIRVALRLYEALQAGDTRLLLEEFPFVKAKLAPPPPPKPKPLPPRASKKPLAPPQITYKPHTEADDLRDALDIGFGQLKFDPADGEDS